MCDPQAQLVGLLGLGSQPAPAVLSCWLSKVPVPVGPLDVGLRGLRGRRGRLPVCAAGGKTRNGGAPACQSSQTQQDPQSCPLSPLGTPGNTHFHSQGIVPGVLTSRATLLMAPQAPTGFQQPGPGRTGRGRPGPPLPSDRVLSTCFQALHGKTHPRRCPFRPSERLVGLGSGHSMLYPQSPKVSDQENKGSRAPPAFRLGGCLWALCPGSGTF